MTLPQYLQAGADELELRHEKRTNGMAATPGPWAVVPYGDGDSLVIHSSELNRVCFMATPGSYGDPERIRADAHLIAAAPDLFAAAKRALTLLKAQGESVRPGNVLGALDAAITKAKGQTT